MRWLWDDFWDSCKVGGGGNLSMSILIIGLVVTCVFLFAFCSPEVRP